MGVNRPLTFLLPLYCFFSGKFMIISYFFGVFRVFSPVNFLYAQPIVFLRSYAPNAPGKLSYSTGITGFLCGKRPQFRCHFCRTEKARKTDLSIFRVSNISY